MLPVAADAGSVGWGIPVPWLGECFCRIGSHHCIRPLEAAQGCTVLLGNQPQIHEGLGLLSLAGNRRETSGTGMFAGTLWCPCQVANSKGTVAATVAHRRQGSRGTNQPEEPSCEWTAGQHHEGCWHCPLGNEVGASVLGRNVPRCLGTDTPVGLLRLPGWQHLPHPTVTTDAASRWGGRFQGCMP